jgi:hypothetical protein
MACHMSPPTITQPTGKSKATGREGKECNLIYMQYKKTALSLDDMPQRRPLKIKPKQPEGE